MSQPTFYLAVILSVLFAVCTLGETWIYRSWNAALSEQQDVQAKLVFGQRQRAFAEQLIRRVAVDSQTDPALLEILKKHKIKVTFPPAAAPADPGHADASPETHTGIDPADK